MGIEPTLFVNIGLYFQCVTMPIFWRVMSFDELVLPIIPQFPFKIFSHFSCNKLLPSTPIRAGMDTFPVDSLLEPKEPPLPALDLIYPWLCNWKIITRVSLFPRDIANFYFWHNCFLFPMVSCMVVLLHNNQVGYIVICFVVIKVVDDIAGWNFLKRRIV